MPLQTASTDPAAPGGFAHDGFVHDLRESVLGLRSALVALYRHVGADPQRPQEVARRFGLNKNLTWKIARILECEDALDAAPLVPGAEGLSILLDALEPSAADQAVASRVRDAAAGFDAMVERHAGDRPTLELLLDGLGASRSLEVSRKLAFRGNSGIWGLQARARVSAQILAPNIETPDRIDIALASGFLDLQRLRPRTHWPLFRFVSYNDDATTPEGGGRRVPLEPSDDPTAPAWIMSSWCDPAVPRLTSVEADAGLTHYLGEGPLGRTGRTTCFCGLYDPATVSRYGDEHNRFGEAATHITLPIETLVFDLFVHRTLVEAMDPEVCVFGRPGGALVPAAGERELQRLPVAERLVSLGGPPPRIATPIMPEYEELMGDVFPRIGRELSEFAAFRLTLSHPPMPSLVVLRYRLPERPA